MIEAKFCEQPRVFPGAQVNGIFTLYALVQVFSSCGMQAGDSVL